MSVTAGDLNDFHRFAETVLSQQQAEDLHELVDIWEIEHASPEFRADETAAVKAAIRDMDQGDQGRPARNVIDELRVEFVDKPAR